MRDIALTLVFIFLLSRSVKRPDIGLNLFSWISLMNPHRLCFGFALSFPYAQLAALVTLIALFTSKEPKKIPWTATSKLLAAFVVWMVITTVFALHPDRAWHEFNLVWKIQLMAFLIMVIATTQQRIQSLMWVMTLSLAYYGVKGGIFTILSGGGARVWGPAGTFIGGNNEIGLALNMTIPLLRYLQLTTTKSTIRWALIAAMLLTFVCVLGTQSRGALIGGTAMVLFLIMKTRNKLPILILLAITLPPVLSFMPESWYSRMNTVKTYEKDASAMGRINAWKTAMSISVQRITGGGYKCLHFEDVFDRYSPNAADVHDAHSIYFEILGEHGIIGLVLFLAIAASAWKTASNTIKLAKKNPDQKWMVDLCAMIQVSLIGYLASGAFLGLAMFDLYYDLIAVLVATNVLARKTATSPAIRAVNPMATLPPERRTFIKSPGGRSAEA